MKEETTADQADTTTDGSPVIALIKAPVVDYMQALEAAAHSARDLLVIALWAALSWWIYVPIHELLHAYGCLWSGGEVTRLEISPWYGADLLQHWFPFVASGSDYAGQLTGFDTKGSDLIYLITVLLPFALTVFPGVPLLLWSAAQTSGPKARMALGLAIPVAYAPFASLTGDYYETGSILVTRLAQWWSPELPLERWRSDDLFLLGEQLFFSGQPYAAQDLIIVVFAALTSLVLAFLTYGLGRFAAWVLLRKP